MTGQIPTSADEQLATHHWLRRSLPAVLWIACVYSTIRVLEIYPNVLAFLVAVFCVGLPICLFGICNRAIHRRRAVDALFRHDSWLARLWQGQILIWARWILVGLGMAVIIVLQAHTLHDIIWLMLVLGIPTFSCAASVLKQWGERRGLHGDIALLFGLRWSRRLISLILILLVTIWSFFSAHDFHDSVADAVRSVAGQISDDGGFVSEALIWFSWLEGTSRYVLGQMSAVQIAPLALLLATIVLGVNVLVLVWAGLALSVFYLPSRIFATANITARTPVGIFMRAAILAFLPFVILPIASALEPFSNQVREWRHDHERDLNFFFERQVVERIHGGPCAYYRDGTAEEIKAFAWQTTAEATEAIRSDIDDVFHHLETEGVPELLDWYYSLPTEYARLGTLLSKQTDGLEAKIKQKVDETIGSKAIDAWHSASSRPEIQQIVERNRKKIDEYAATVLSENCLDDDLEIIDVIRTFRSLDELTGIIDALDNESASARLASSGAVVGITAPLAAKLASKIAIKAGGGLLAKAATGGATGAAAGAVIGSAVPVAGTLAGGLAGLIAGIAVGVGVDYGILVIDEALNREAIEAELIDGLRNLRQQMLSEVLPDNPE